MQQSCPQVTQDVELVHTLLSTLHVDDSLVGSITLPAEVSMIGALHALNCYHQQIHHSGLPIIQQSDISFVYPELHTLSPTSDSPRIISVHLAVPNTQNLTREEQALVLKERNLTFASPDEIALIVGAFTCGHYDYTRHVDLLGGLDVRTNVPGKTIRNVNSLYGVELKNFPDDYRHSEVMVAGVVNRS